jgi:hypothetical protein
VDSWSPGRDLNSGPSQYDARVLTIQPQRSVVMMLRGLLDSVLEKHDDDHVNWPRLRLSTVATNEHIVHLPGDI